jgi:hypothetical protein
MLGASINNKIAENTSSNTLTTRFFNFIKRDNTINATIINITVDILNEIAIHITSNLNYLLYYILKL